MLWDSLWALAAGLALAMGSAETPHRLPLGTPDAQAPQRLVRQRHRPAHWQRRQRRARIETRHRGHVADPLAGVSYHTAMC